MYYAEHRFRDGWCQAQAMFRLRSACAAVVGGPCWYPAKCRKFGSSKPRLDEESQLYWLATGEGVGYVIHRPLSLEQQRRGWIITLSPVLSLSRRWRPQCTNISIEALWCWSMQPCRKDRRSLIRCNSSRQFILRLWRISLRNAWRDKTQKVVEVDKMITWERFCADHGITNDLAVLFKGKKMPKYMTLFDAGVTVNPAGERNASANNRHIGSPNA